MAQSTAEKKSRFARVAVPRIESAINQFRLIGNCSSKSNYEWDQLKPKKIFVHILISAELRPELCRYLFDQMDDT